jgi:uncharacterized protein YgbK (DUF1537 family)
VRRAAILAVLDAVLGTLARAFLAWLDRRAQIDAATDAAISDAQAQTQTAISEIADAQKQIVAGGSAADIALRLRRRAADEARSDRGRQG